MAIFVISNIQAIGSTVYTVNTHQNWMRLDIIDVDIVSIVEYIWY